MRYWLLCGKLKVIENRAYGYHIGGETMGIKTSRFEKIIGDAIRAISDLSNCLEKAEKERNDALELLHSYRHICGETPPERLSELVQADREGRCVVLPVKPRETFYTIDRVSTLCHLGYYFDDYDCQGCEEKFCDGGLSLDVGKKTGYSRSQVLSFIDSGKKIYLSEQEAESALKAMKEREDDDRP